MSNLVASLLLVPFLSTGAPSGSLDRKVLAMGTELRLHLEGPGDPGRASERALAEGARIEAACSTWDPDSPWSRMNAAGGGAVPLDREWIGLLGRLQALGQWTGGAFDPVLLALVRAWALREGGRIPGPAELAEAREASGAGLLLLDPAGGKARLAHPGAGVEEGGFLKGYALDRMKGAAGTPAGLLDFGGQLLAWGPGVPVSIADPVDRFRPRIGLRLRNASLAGSGASERGRHILDPRTGLPCPAWGSVAVVAPEALRADVLSTALFVLGPEAGPAWAERHGVAAAFLLPGGSVRMTRAFRALDPVLIPQESP